MSQVRPAPPSGAHDVEALTMGMSLRLEELVHREHLGEMVRSFHQLFGIPIRIFGSEGALLADAVVDQPLCQYVGSFPTGASACASTVAAAKRAEPPAAGQVTHACFSGAAYRIVPIEYDQRRIGKIILGPYLPAERTEVPRTLLEVHPRVEPQRARDLLARMPRARAETVSQIASHLTSALDLILFSGHKALLTSQMHLATVRESYRELQEKNRKLQEAYDKLKELDRLKSNFLGTVSHELRTPLTSIIGYSEMLGEGIAGDINDEQKEFVQTIREKGEQLLALIMSLLDMSKLESGTMSLRKAPTSLHKILAEVVSTLSPNARKRNVRIECDVPARLPELRADSERLRQVFLNLTENAVKFSPAGGVVKIMARLGMMTVEDETDGLALLAPSQQALEVQVIDQGIGIPEAERAKVFDAFYQTDSSSTREYGGTGLGLSIVKRLVEAHGGSVEVAANVPRGTIFRVRIPFELG